MVALGREERSREPAVFSRKGVSRFVSARGALPLERRQLGGFPPGLASQHGEAQEHP